MEGYFYSQVKPTPLENPRVACLSDSALKLIDLDSEIVNGESELYAEYFSGNKLIEGS